jgi:hypothetical protein
VTTGQIISLVFAAFTGLFALVKLYLHDQGEIKKSLIEHADRLSRIEERNRNAPTHDDLKQIYERLNVLATGNAHIMGTLDGIKTTNEMIVRKAMGEIKNG